MVSRILSTLLLWGVILGSLWFFESHAAIAILTLLSSLTLHEFYQLTEKMGFKPFRWMSLTFGAVLTAGTYYLSVYVFDGDEFMASSFSPLVLALAIVAFCIRILGERDTSNRIESLIATVIGLVYVPFMLHFLVRLMLIFDETAGLIACLWVVAVSKFCDVGALLSGLAFGKHKMAPNISPKKTWEGAIGGVLTSAGIGAGLAWLTRDYGPVGLTPLVGAIVAVPLAMVTIVSDLIESAMKRRADIKDTGKVIPGIGGAFDLTDSLILTAPLAYAIFRFLD